jgi:E3 ubiquitin-protein ligase SHPRH
VFCYYAEGRKVHLSIPHRLISSLYSDTVERNILDLAARKGASLYTKENSAGTLNIASLATGVEKEVVDAPIKNVKNVQKGDFISKSVYMLMILLVKY